jgi:hypothetical protein
MTSKLYDEYQFCLSRSFRDPSHSQIRTSVMNKSAAKMIGIVKNLSTIAQAIGKNKKMRVLFLELSEQVNKDSTIIGGHSDLIS